VTIICERTFKEEMKVQCDQRGGAPTQEEKERSLGLHACNPSTQEAEAEDHEFTASLGYIVRPFLKRKREEEEEGERKEEEEEEKRGWRGKRRRWGGEGGGRRWKRRKRWRRMRGRRGRRRGR
jgi:hypothetical protein